MRFARLLLVLFIYCTLAPPSLEAVHKFPKTKTKKYNLSVAAVFRNEAKYLKEWIEFHRLVGVDHFYLYNTGSTDRYMDALKGYIKDGIVTLIQWPDFSKEKEEHWALGCQVPAYENAIKWAAVNETKWLVFLDVDEFLFPIDGKDLTEVIEKYKQYPGVILSHAFFDASRAHTLPKRNLVIEATEMRAPPPPNPVRTFEKMIFKPELCTYFTWPPYRFVFKDDQAPVKLSKWEGRINRYIDRNTPGLFDLRKLKTPLRIDYRSAEQEVNELLEVGYEVEDHTIDRFVPILRKKMGL